ncbi:MAG: MFS transporter [Candidatus Latescibacterota bacterium]
MSPKTATFSRTDINTGLRGFFYWIVFMGGYWQTALASSPIFVGYVLALGASDSAPSDFISLLYLMGLLQLVSHLFTNRIRNKKLLVIVSGIMEPGTLILLIILPFFVSKHEMIILIPFIIMLSAGFAHLANPLLNAWYGSLIPDSIRASYIGRRIMISQLTAIIAMFAAGQIVDMFKGLTGFYITFALGIILAVIAYLSLSPVRYTPQISSRQIKFGDIFRIPKENSQFSILCLFYGVWSIGFYIALPNLNVLMIRHLHLSYSMVALYTNCQLVMMLVGYFFWPRYIQKFGPKPVLKLILIPLSLVPLVWFLAEPSNHYILAPAMMLYGFTTSGTIVSSNTHLFTILPKDERSPAYMVFWLVTVFLSMALGPKLGSIIISLSQGLNLTWGFVTVMNVKLALLVVSVSFLASFFILLKIKEKEHVPSRVLVDEIFRRNPVSLAYNMFVLERSGSEDTRADALEKLGKTRGAVAFDTIADALEDISPVVRRQAAASIGETRLPEAVAPLAGIIRDPESDIKSEAVSSLGMIDTPESRQEIFTALINNDPSVRAAAVRALGRFNNDDVEEKLLELVLTERDPVVFTSLADTIADRKDLRAVEALLRGREFFQSPKIRKQILHSLACMFGAGDEYYSLISSTREKAAIKTGEYLDGLLVQIVKNGGDMPQDIVQCVGDLAEAFNENDTSVFLECAERLAILSESLEVDDENLKAVAFTMHSLVNIKREGKTPNLPGKAFIAVCAGMIVRNGMKKKPLIDPVDFS